MAKKKKRTRKKKTSSVSNNIPFKMIILGVCILVAAAGTFMGIRYFFLNSEFFQVKNIVINRDVTNSFKGGENYLQERVEGLNIFKVDLDQLKDSIQSKVPQLKKVEVRRNLPDTIEINVTSRVPVAVIDTLGGVVIDSDAVVLAKGTIPGELVQIKGVSFFINRPRIGQKIYNKSLNKVVSLLQVVNKKIPVLDGKIRYIDTSNKNNLLINIDGVIIKLGADDFLRKIDVLKGITQDANVNINDMRYIDLRFDEVVMAPR